MNEEALNDVFTLSLNAGYTKDLEAFKELMVNNEEARADAFSLAVEAGYTKDINAFSELMGAEPGKANVQSVGAAVDGNQAPKSEEASGADSSGGSVDPPVYFETNKQTGRLEPTLAFMGLGEDEAIMQLEEAYPNLKGSLETTGMLAIDKVSFNKEKKNGGFFDVADNLDTGHIIDFDYNINRTPKKAAAALAKPKGVLANIQDKENTHTLAQTPAKPLDLTVKFSDEAIRFGKEIVSIDEVDAKESNINTHALDLVRERWGVEKQDIYKGLLVANPSKAGKYIDSLTAKLMKSNPELSREEAMKFASRLVTDDPDIEYLQQNFGLTDKELAKAKDKAIEDRVGDLVGEEDNPRLQSEVGAMLLSKAHNDPAYALEYKRRIQDESDYEELTDEKLRTTTTLGGRVYIPITSYKFGSKWTEQGYLTDYSNVNPSINYEAISSKADELNTEGKHLNSEMELALSLRSELKDSDVTSSSTPEEIAAFNTKLDKYNAEVQRIEASGINKRVDAFSAAWLAHDESLAKYDKQQSEREGINYALDALSRNYNLGTLMASSIEEGLISPISSAFHGISSAERLDRIQKRNEFATTYKPAHINAELSLAWAGQALAESLPSIIPMTGLAIPGVGMAGTLVPFFFMGAGGDMELQQLRRKQAAESLPSLKTALLNTTDVGEKSKLIRQIEEAERLAGLSNTQIVAGSLAKGTTEVVAEAFGSLRVIRAGRHITRHLTKGGIRGKIAASYLVGRGVGIEMAEETITQISNNLVDLKLYGDDRHLLDGLNKDFYAQTAFTSLLIQGPSITKGLFRAAANTMVSYNTGREQILRVKRIAKLEAALKKTKPAWAKAAITAEIEKEISDMRFQEEADIANFRNLTEEERQKWLKVRKGVNKAQDRATILGQEYDAANIAKDTKLAAKIKAELDELKADMEAALLDSDQIVINSVNRSNASIEQPSVKNRAALLQDTAFELGKKAHNSYVAKLIAESEGLNFIEVTDEMLDANRKLTPEAYGKLKAKYGTRLADAVKAKQAEGQLASFERTDGAIISFAHNADIHIHNAVANITMLKEAGETSQEALEDLELELERLSGGGVHEVLHAYHVGRLLDGETGELTDTAIAAIEEMELNLLKYIKANTKNKAAARLLEKVRGVYKKDKNGNIRSEAVIAEELLAALGEMQLRNIISFETTGGANYHIINMAKEMANQAIAAVNSATGGNLKAMDIIHLNSAEDVGKYIEGFRRAVAKQSVKIHTTEPEDYSEEGARASLDLSDKIQTIYEEQGVDGKWDIAQAYRGLVITKVAKYRNVPGYESVQDLIVDEVLTGKRGVLGMVESYNPDLGIPLSAYINTYLEVRTSEEAKKLLAEEFTEDVTERKDIVAPPASQSADVLAEDAAPSVATFIRKKLRLDEKQMNVVRRAAIRALVTAPGLGKVVAGKPRAFYDHLLKTYNTLLFKMVKNHMGTGADYRMWVKQNFEILDKHISIASLLNGKMDLFYKPVLNANGTQARMSVIEANDAGIPLDKAGSGPLKWQRISPTPAEFYDWAMGKGMAVNTKPARKTTMARLLARELGLDATMETLNNATHPKFDEAGNAEDGSINVLAHVANATGNNMAESAIIATVSAITGRQQDQRFQTALTELTPAQIEDARKGLKFYGLNTGSRTLNGHIKNLVTWREINGHYGTMTMADHVEHLESDTYKELFRKAVATYNRRNTKLLKDRLKKSGAIEKYLVTTISEVAQHPNPARIFGLKGAWTKEAHIMATKTLFAVLDGAGIEKGEALRLVIRWTQPDLSQRGTASPFRTNTVYKEKVLDPIIKDNGLENQFDLEFVDLKGLRVRDDNSKATGHMYETLTYKGKKITPAGSLDQNDPLMAKLINGTLLPAELKRFNDHSLIVRDELMLLARTLGEANHDLLLRWIMPMQGSMSRSMARWGFVMAGVYINKSDPNGAQTIEHHPPVTTLLGYLSMYAKGIISEEKMNDVWETAELYAHPKEAADRLNKIAKEHNPFLDGKNEFGVAARVAAFNENNEYTDAETITKRADSGSRASLHLGINEILERSSKMPAGRVISPTEAIKLGKKASRHLQNQGIMISAAEDFVGLMYKMLGRGKTGEADLEWLLDKLVIPYDMAVDNVSIARLLKSEQLRKISKSAKLKSMLNTEAFNGMTGEDAVRLYIWNLRGVAKGKFVKETYVDMAADYMSKNPELKAYADAVHAIAGAVAYAAPNARWAHGSIEMDLVGGINGELRALELEQSGWSLNVKEIFSEDNLNKLESLYGVNYVTALKNILQRMKSGRNRIDQETDKTSKKAQGWISNQVGAIMFLNMRSALLQGLSALNYINTTDHNPLQAIRRMLNVPQYAKDTKFLLGSAFMKDRRMGMRIDVNEEDVARASRDTGNVISRALKIALNKGFIPTRLMDTAAIVIGGAGFYRSRINTYVDSGMSIASAEKMAFADFRKATINSQQSSDPRMVSQQQASTMGRFVLQFGNTPGQYTRIQIKAVKDIINGRGDMKAHIGKILYYGMIQQALFTFAQQALWVALLDDDDEWITSEEGRGLVDGMLSSTLRGLGLYGAIIDTAMRTAKVWEKETSKGYMGSNEKVVIEALGISPSVKSIAKKTTNAMNISKYRGDDFGIDPYSLHSPEVEQAAWLLEGTVNIPSKRILDKMHHIESIMAGQNEAWQNVALFFGFQEWQVGTGEGGKKAKQRKLENKGLSGPVKKEKKIKKSISDMTDAEFKAWRIKNPAE